MLGLSDEVYNVGKIKGQINNANYNSLVSCETGQIRSNLDRNRRSKSKATTTIFFLLPQDLNHGYHEFLAGYGNPESIEEMLKGDLSSENQELKFAKKMFHKYLKSI